MSFGTISKSVYDSALRERIMACTVQQSWNNVSLGETEYGKLLHVSPERAADMVWPVCIATDVEQAYAYALESNNPSPGGDESVVTEGMILANVQYKWPPDPVVVVPQ